VIKMASTANAKKPFRKKKKIGIAIVTKNPAETNPLLPKQPAEPVDNVPDSREHVFKGKPMKVVDIKFTEDVLLGIRFGTCINNMTHIRKISDVGEAARLSHGVLRVKCTLVCIDRRPIDRDIYDAQALARACVHRDLVHSHSVTNPQLTSSG
jgi:hypothetical protein